MLPSAQIAALIVLQAVPGLACPGLDWTGKPYLGDVSFSNTHGLSHLSLSSRAGGVWNLRDCGLDGEGLTGYRGDGLVDVRPDLLVHWQGQGHQLVIGLKFDEPALLLIHDPEGRWYLDDGRVKDPMVVIDGPPVGDYAIYLGSHGTARFTRPGTLIISETGP